MNLYSIIVLLSIIFLIVLVKKKSKIDEGKFYEVFFFTFIFSILGAKIFHILENFDFYIQFPELLSLTKGYSILGAIAFGYFTLNAMQKNLEIDLSQILLHLFLYLPIAQSIGRIGNIFNNELLPFSYYEIILNIFNFGILYLIYKKNSNLIIPVYFINYGIIRTYIEYIKGNNLNFLMIVSISFLIYGIYQIFKLSLKR